MRVATYNIHGAVGLDRRRRPERIAEVLASLEADVIGLQEVEGRRSRSSPIAASTRRSILHSRWGST